MKNTNQWLQEYGESHQNIKNIYLHKICVPLIFWSVLALLYSWKIGPVRAVYPVSFMALLFYLRLGIKPGMLMLVQISFFICLTYWIDSTPAHLVELSPAIFIIGWIGQFIGHKIEGKKPSFFQDLQFLLIGPLWVFKSFLDDPKSNK